MMIHGKQSEEAIRIEAYLLSESAGHPFGMEAEFWTQAEAIVHGRVAALVGKAVMPKPPAAKKKSKTPVAGKSAAKASIVVPTAAVTIPTVKKAVATKQSTGKKPATKTKAAKPTASTVKTVSGSKSKPK